MRPQGSEAATAAGGGAAEGQSFRDQFGGGGALGEMALTIVSTQVPTGDAPICDVMLEPYIVIKEGDGPGTRCHVPDEGCLESGARFRLRSRWFRAMMHRGSAVCSVHPDREAAIQCLLCLRAHAPTPLSFHCSPDCLKEHWHLHKDNYHVRQYQNGGAQGGRRSSPLSLFFGG